jgi:hypothetical protein
VINERNGREEKEMKKKVEEERKKMVTDGQDEI